MKTVILMAILFSFNSMVKAQEYQIQGEHNTHEIESILDGKNHGPQENSKNNTPLMIIMGSMILWFIGTRFAYYRIKTINTGSSKSISQLKSIGSWLTYWYHRSELSKLKQNLLGAQGQNEISRQNDLDQIKLKITTGNFAEDINKLGFAIVDSNNKSQAQFRLLEHLDKYKKPIPDSQTIVSNLIELMGSQPSLFAPIMPQ
jgi:hypothetical protein